MIHLKQALGSTTTASKLQNCETLETFECEGCGNEVRVMRFTIPFGPYKGQTQKSKIGCDCDLLQQIEKEQQEAKRSRLQHIFEQNSLINPSLQNASFENFERGEFANQFQKAWNFVETFELKSPRSLFFQGSFGTGKSHLSVSIAKELTKRGYSTIFISIPKLLTKIRVTYNKDSEYNEERILQAIAEADLVVFDDIGAEGDNATGWGMQKIFEVIDQRAGKHNIYTTNLTSAEFEATKDMQRIFSRMMMNSEPIIMNGTDYRKRQFLKGAKENV